MNALAAPEESPESHGPSEGAALHAGPLEQPAGASLVSERSLPVVLVLQAASACSPAPDQVDPLGDAVEAGGVPEIRHLLRSHLDGILP